jgi:hypothetical protein
MRAALLALALVPQQAARDYPAFVWRAAHPAEPLPSEVIAPFGGVNVEGAREDPWVLEEGLDFYVGHAPGRDALHLEHETPWYAELWERFYEERDPRALVRRPCLSEPATLEDLRRRLARTLAARGGRHGHGLSLGDEVGLTPYGAPLDLCASPACEAGFAAFLDGHPRWGGLAPASGALLPPHDTDTVRRLWIDGDRTRVPLWLARRDFQHEVVHRVLLELAREARRLAPGTPVGLFGQSGRTAFGDVGVERVLPALDFLEVYRILDARELLHTLRRPGQRAYLTVFDQPDAPHGASWIAWEHWLRGGDGLVIWSDRELEERPRYRDSLARTVAASRRLRAELPGWAPDPRGVAVLHAPHALALSWLRDSLLDGPTWPRRFPSYQNEHGTRELALRAVLRLCEDAGLLPGSVPLEDLDGAAGARFPLLVAVHLEMVTDEELARLTAHLEAGGRLALVGPFATFDGHLERRERSGPEAFPEALRERVAEVRLEPRQVLARRGSAPPPGLAAWLPDWREPDAPRVELRAEEGAPPWLRALRRVGDDWVLAALVGASSPEARATLAPVTVEVEVPEGWELEWLHPTGAGPSLTRRTLPAGEPLVVRLRRP